MTDRQKAAHLVLPLVAELVQELKDENTHIALQAQVSRKNKEATNDWNEFAARAEGRLEGARRVAALLQVLARG